MPPDKANIRARIGAKEGKPNADVEKIEVLEQILQTLQAIESNTRK